MARSITKKLCMSSGSTQASNKRINFIIRIFFTQMMSAPLPNIARGRKHNMVTKPKNPLNVHIITQDVYLTIKLIA